MPRIWAVLGVISIILGIVFYFDQELGRGSHWSWKQLVNYETAISITIFVGIALLVVAIVEFVWNKVKTRQSK